MVAETTTKSVGDVEPDTPTPILSTLNVEGLLAQLRPLGENRWIALATYFDVTA
jgi:hypothetical protein